MQWLSVIRQQAIIWGNADPDLCRHMALLTKLQCVKMIDQSYLDNNIAATRHQAISYTNDDLINQWSSAPFSSKTV